MQEFSFKCLMLHIFKSIMYFLLIHENCTQIGDSICAVKTGSMKIIVRSIDLYFLSSTFLVGVERGFQGLLAKLAELILQIGCPSYHLTSQLKSIYHHGKAKKTMILVKMLLYSELHSKLILEISTFSSCLTFLKFTSLINKYE